MGGKPPFFELWQYTGILLSTADALALRYLRGSEWISVFMRCMGAKVGVNVCFQAVLPCELDLYSFEDGVVISDESVLQGHLLSTEELEFRRTNFRCNSKLLTGASVLCGSTVGEQSSIMPRSLILSGEILEPYSTWRGCPATRFEIETP